jgi:hypothetical protein
MINSIAEWIKTQLETITDLTGKVYIHANDNIEYPASMIMFLGSEGEDVSNKTTWRVYHFKVRTVYDLSSGTLNEESVDEKLYDLTDSIIDLFEINRKAGGVAQLLSPVAGSCDWLDDNRQLRYNDILLDFRTTRTAG